MARNSTERLGGVYDLELRKSAFSCTPKHESTHQLLKHLTMWYYTGFNGVGVFCAITCTAATFTRTNQMVFGNLHILTSRIAVVICSECSFREGCSRELAYSPILVIRQQALDWGRVFSF